MRFSDFSVYTGIILLLGACAPLSPENMSSAYSQASNSTLWAQHSLTSSPLDLAFIEAELASRGQQRSSSASGQYLGQRTASAIGQQRYDRTSTVSADRSCSDFSSPAAAQKAFLASGGPIKDLYGLDRDGDGLACEWGTYLRRSVSSYQSALRTARATTVRSTPRRRSSGRCYVGPRGGTYTITASGNKNYNGC